MCVNNRGCNRVAISSTSVKYTFRGSVTQSSTIPADSSTIRYGNLPSSRIPLSPRIPISARVLPGARKVFDIRELQAQRANIDARRTEITAILDVPGCRGSGMIGDPSLRICLRSRSSIVACSMKQMHIASALLGDTEAQLSAYMCISVSLYTYICVHCRYTLQDTLRRRVFTYQSDDGLSQRDVKPRYPLTDRAMVRDDTRRARIFLAFRLSILESMVKLFFFIFAFFSSHKKETLLRIRRDYKIYLRKRSLLIKNESQVGSGLPICN